MDPEHVAFEAPPCHTYLCFLNDPNLPGTIITLRASASLRKQRSSVSHFRIQIVRQHTKIASEMSPGPCLTASKHEKSRNPSSDKTCSPAGLRTQHFNEHALLGEPCLIPNECYSSPASRSDRWILSTSCLKGPLAINMFASLLTPTFPAPLLLSELQLL